MKSKGPFFPAKHAGKCPINFVDGHFGTHAIIVGDLIVRLERPVQWTELRHGSFGTVWNAQCVAEYVHLTCFRKYQELSE